MCCMMQSFLKHLLKNKVGQHESFPKMKPPGDWLQRWSQTSSSSRIADRIQANLKTQSIHQIPFSPR